MQWFDRNMGWASVAGVFLLVFVPTLQAQSLWKYTDKDGKVTYSDKAPKAGEKAELVNATPNSIEAPRNTVGGVPQKLKDVTGRAADREARRDQLQAELNAAREAVSAARKALDDGREPLASETQIVVGRGKDGAPTGANSSIRQPEYYARIAELEESVKKAEAKAEMAEENFRRKAP